MESLAKVNFTGETFPNFSQPETHRSESTMWDLAQTLISTGASAVGMANGILISGPARPASGSRLLPLRTSIDKLQQTRGIAAAMGVHPLVVACTHAYDARSLAGDGDTGDRRYLTGVRTSDGAHAYCGGMEASISRALAYAPYADVLCYRASRVNLPEAQYFAAAIQASFPNMRLGVGFSRSVPDHPRGLESIPSVERLRSLGYDYCFRTSAESTVYPAFSAGRMWVFFDDVSHSRHELHGADWTLAASLDAQQFRLTSTPCGS